MVRTIWLRWLSCIALFVLVGMATAGCTATSDLNADTSLTSAEYDVVDARNVANANWQNCRFTYKHYGRPWVGPDAEHPGQLRPSEVREGLAWNHCRRVMGDKWQTT